MSTARQEALQNTTVEDVADWWATEISDIEPGIIRLRGYAIEDLIDHAGFVDAIWMMVRGDLPNHDQTELLEKALVAAIDHGPQAPSIAAARMAATCGVGLQGAVSTGVGMLGDVHGGAGQQCMQVLATIKTAAADSNISTAVAASLSEFRRTGRHVPGFGHRFHPRDPRRDPLLRAVADKAESGVVEGLYLAIAEELERQLAQGHSNPIPLNIDGATAVVYSELGFPPELGRGLFILSRSVGILAHSWEEAQSGRRIKGPIPRPLLPSYRGHAERGVSRT
ncbi:citryl-CoA lyase [Nocardia sp. NRRL WC-3656]|uniref:citryl-CoA lyase n=1 Tax=Nocardia sp. NRRL WC-3656 TaxID=1463824 RepID=UPI0009DF31BD|nr:citryl-CoA lyase [Nocardia sp. NRRL WC-3656]